MQKRPLSQEGATCSLAAETGPTLPPQSVASASLVGEGEDTEGTEEGPLSARSLAAFCFAEVLPGRRQSAEQREPGGLVVSVVGSARSLGCSQDLRARSLRMCHKKKGYVQARALQPETSAA